MEVKLIDSMGTDLTVVNAARVSFHKESEWEDKYGEDEHGAYTDIQLSEKDQKLIKYLSSHNHWTPFSHVMITMREKVPIFVARQRFKHMVGFTYNEVSRRYVDDAPEFYKPDVWRKRAENKKQGSSDEVITSILREPQYKLETDSDGIKLTYERREENIQTSYERLIRQTTHLYNDMIEAGVAPEQARMVLPQSLYTEYYVTGSLAAWARAYKLRIDPHAQKEIQDLAKMWGDIIGNMKELEHSWKALTSEAKKENEGPQKTDASSDGAGI